jgi:hypothetical protein
MRLPRGIRVGAACLLTLPALLAQQVGTNVNMVTGTQWPGGDPFLQRQNEPSMAISSRNPLHMVAGDNDYRTVDLPGASGEVEPTGDAWLGFFTSFNGGQTWSSVLVPGYPQDTSLQGEFSPLHGLGAAADPTVRAGTNGMFYYSGLAFNRQQGGTSKVFVATYTDNNNLEGGNPIEYLWTIPVATGTSNLFEDKPSIAVDIPRSWSGVCIVPALPLQNTQIFPAGTVYIAWTQFTGNEANGVAAIMYSHSIDCGLTWSPPQQISGTAKTNQGATLAIDPNTGALYIAWRVFASTSPTQVDAVEYVASFDGGNTFTKAALVTNIDAFDQGDTDVSFRTNDYPTIAVDDASHVYLAWSQRGASLVNEDAARIELITGTPTSNPKSIPLQWGNPILVDPQIGVEGHQVMPAMAFSAGKLTVAWYDFRNDDLIQVYSTGSQNTVGQYSFVLENDCVFSALSQCNAVPAFGEYIQDPAPGTAPPEFEGYPANAWRQTVDVRAAQAPPGNPPAFLPSVEVTQYQFGSVPGANGSITPGSAIQQLQVDPPNLPMFQTGTLPFFGDYIDVAGPTFIPNSNGTWRFNNLPTDPDFTHVVWTDNRDVVPPPDGNWSTYTPPTYGTTTTSIFDPTQTRPACSASTTGYTGDRNQNIYTAQLSPGLGLSAPGNAKQLGAGSNGQLIQRQFPIVVSNTTAVTGNYTLTIGAQPTGGTASFIQSPMAGVSYPLTAIEVQVPPLSSTSRAIFVTSTNAHATVTVTATSTSPVRTAVVTINGDPNNPPSADPNITSEESYTPTLATPNIANPNIANPNIANPNIANPNIANPNIANPNIANPNIANPNIANPNIANPNIANPNIANTALADGGSTVTGTITDGNWTVTNTGNTSSAYAVNVTGQTPPAGVTLQLIVSGIYTTPLAQGCTLSTQSHFVPIANITNVTFSTVSQFLSPAATNPTLPGLALQPGQTAYITLRVYDANTNNPAQALIDYNPITQASPVVVSQGVNTGATHPPVTLTILTKTLPQATLTGIYPSQTLQATGGSGAYTWSIISGTPPTGITLSTAGVLAATSVTSGTSSFTVQVKDAAGDIAQQLLTIVVNPAPAISPASLPAATQNALYSQAFSVSPATGTAPFTWSASSLPSWLTFNNATATLSGTPTSSGPVSFTIKVTDANGATASITYTLQVNPATPANLTFTSSPNLPNGQFMSPYPPVMMTATGGSGSYTWVIGSALPLGMTLNPTTGVISGTPFQAGQWQSGVIATDNVNPSLTTGFQRINITVGLATAYAGGGNCYMPYPATPLFNPGDSTSNNWSVGASGALAGQFSILPASATGGGGSSTGNNDVLVGCPTGATSGTYQLTFNISSGDTLTLPLQVVGQDTQDNSVPAGANNGYYINSEGVGGGLPPQSVQQGVVNTSQANIGPLTLSYGADTAGFAGNFLFGFNGIGVDSNGCANAAAAGANVTLSAAPANPGRYDLLFNGTTSACPSSFPAPFPTSPAPIVFESVDALSSAVTWKGSTVSSVALSTTAGAPAPQLQQGVLNALDLQQQTSTPTIPVTVNFTAGPASGNAILVGLSTDYTPQACLSNPSGTVSTSVNVPNVPGRYYIAIDTLAGNTCVLNWSSGSPGVSQFIGIVDVWATSTPPFPPGTFSATGSMNAVRAIPTVTLLQNGQVLVAGGCSSDPSIGPCNPVASAELYNPNTGLFTVTGSMSAPRFVHTATLLPNGQVLITGGQSTSGVTLAIAELYNPSTGVFTLTGLMNAARQNQTATLLQNGQVLVAGGNNNSSPLASAELYNPSTGVFTLTGSMGTARYVPMAALLPNGQVLITGGITNPNPTYVPSAELYNPTTGTFSYTGSMSTARGYFTATALQNGQVLAAGGYNGSALVTSAEIYDPTLGSFSLTGSMTNLQGGPATLLGDGQVLFAGGYNGSTQLATSELYNPTTAMFSLTGSMTMPRNGAGATLLANGQVLVVGGADSAGVLASAELYQPPN